MLDRASVKRSTATIATMAVDQDSLHAVLALLAGQPSRKSGRTMMMTGQKYRCAGSGGLLVIAAGQRKTGEARQWKHLRCHGRSRMTRGFTDL
jgi:hypothetical protein